MSAGANDDVLFRGLSFNGINGSGLSGIVYNSGAQLSIDKCTIFGFNQDAINANTSTTAELYITGTYITNSAN